MANNQNNSHPRFTYTGKSWTVIQVPYNYGYIGVDLAVPVEKKKSGCTCETCKEFNEYAESNQPNDKFICYRCRIGW